MAKQVKMESRPARLFGCAWRANGRKAVTRQALEGKGEEFIHMKNCPFPQRPKDKVCFPQRPEDKVCDFTALLLIYEGRKDHV